MNDLAALRSIVAELEREYRELGGDDVRDTHFDRGSGDCGVETAVDGVRPRLSGGDLLDVAGRSGGNPNHDPADGKFTTGPGGGHGKRWARRQRRKRRLRRKLRELKATHTAERRGLAARQRERHARHRERFDRKRASLDRHQAHELKRMDAEHAREIAGMERRRDRERAQEAVQKGKGKVADEQIAKWEADHARDVESAKDSNAKIRGEREDMQEFDRAVLRDERKAWADDIRAEHARRRRGMLRRQRDERAEAIEEHGFKRRKKGSDARSGVLAGGGDGRPGGGGGRGGVAMGSGGAAQMGVARDIGPGRTHKASSAESILRHCLRRLGLSAAYRHGQLTGDQSLEVLDAVRDYSRAWLRHECEALIRHYGRAIDGRTAAGYVGSPGIPDGISGYSPRGGYPGVAGGVGDSRRGRSEDRGDDLPAGQADRPAGGGDAGSTVLRGLSSAMRLHVGRFFDRVRGFVRESIIAGAMALSGPGGLTPDDLAEADRQHAVQVAYLDQFRRDVESRGPAELSEPTPFAVSGAMSAPEMAARAEMYGSATWSASHEINRRGVIHDGRAVRERRFHWRPKAEDHPCGTCAAESAKGWVPVGTLLKIGDSECLGIGCDCYFVYEMPDGTNFITRRGWRGAA